MPSIRFAHPLPSSHVRDQARVEGIDLRLTNDLAMASAMEGRQPLDRVCDFHCVEM